MDAEDQSDLNGNEDIMQPQVCYLPSDQNANEEMTQVCYLSPGPNDGVAHSS